jgi:carbon-monoxide dehydrogenase medium subunit
LNEALNLLNSDEEAKILAGGQSLTTLMKLRVASPQTLIDINGLRELSYVGDEDGTVRIGSLVRHDELARNSTIRQELPLLAEAAAMIADQQIRNRGTVGGSLAHADPTADLPTAFTASNATIVTASVKGSRSIESVDFFRDYFTTSLNHDEIIREVRVPVPPAKSGSAYLKLTKGHNDFAIVAVAVQLTFSDGVCSRVNVVLGGVASTPIHAKGTEELLRGRQLNDDAIQESARRAAEGLKPPSDIRASAEYRLQMTRKLTQRAITISAQRAIGRV